MRAVAGEVVSSWKLGSLGKGSVEGEMECSDPHESPDRELGKVMQG